MFRSISNNLYTANSAVAGAVATAALVAGIAVCLIPAAPVAKAEAKAAPSHLAKLDRLPVVTKEMACSLTSWPNYGPSCQFDLRMSSTQTRTVRTIALR
jgi:hypothetical protein